MCCRNAAEKWARCIPLSEKHAICRELCRQSNAGGREFCRRSDPPQAEKLASELLFIKKNRGTDYSFLVFKMFYLRVRISQFYGILLFPFFCKIFYETICDGFRQIKRFLCIGVCTFLCIFMTFEYMCLCDFYYVVGNMF